MLDVRAHSRSASNTAPRTRKDRPMARKKKPTYSQEGFQDETADAIEVVPVDKVVTVREWVAAPEPGVDLGNASKGDE